ncbi:MAG: hypothetical protein DRN08_00615 [Thermoplasmata archaeon]|nr:MAG: hypothetical protein DRN08_00615 [Thermoplasmata archaeon]
MGVDVDADLSWSGGDPDPGDVVTYDVYFGTSTPPPLVVNNQSSTVYDPGTMSYMTTYYWKIVAWDNHGAKSIGQIWSFTTEESSQNNPPNKPDINGPTSGYVGINYTFSAAAIDPDGDQVYYLFDWGDGNTSDWLGPFLSGESINMNHSWLRKGIYNIRVKAKDTHGNESMWSDPFQISISKNIEITNIKTGYVYFFIPAFNRSYAYINIFDRLGVSVIFTIDLLHINVTVGEMVSSVKFVIKSIIFEDELVSYDNDTTDGCLCDFNITTGLYGLTVYAYDEEQNEIDSDMIPYLLFINLSTIRQMRGK